MGGSLGGLQGMQDFLPNTLHPSTTMADNYSSATNSSAAAMLQLSNSGGVGVPDDLSSSYGFAHTCSSLNLFTGYEQQMMLAMTLMTQAQQGLQQLQSFHPGIAGAQTAGIGNIGLQNNHFLNQSLFAQTGTTLSNSRREDAIEKNVQGNQEASSSSSSSSSSS